MTRRSERPATVLLRALAAVLTTGLAGVLLAGCAAARPSGANNEAVEAHDSELATVVAAGLEVPWSIAFVGETPFVSERDTARILEIDGADAGGSGKVSDARVIATIEGVAPRGEAGLLGIAVHEGYLYAYFSTPGDNRVQRFELEGLAGGDDGTGSDVGGGSLTLGPAETIIEGIPVAGNHNGGRIAFGPDGMLYVTTGDAGDPPRSQDMGSLGGKILRVTPTGAVPADNPFAGSPVFTLGHRNPQGIAWADNGTMFASEFGQNTWDELNVIEAGSNYGWPDVEGTGGDPRFVDPVQQWATSEASPSGISIVGDTIYIANLRGERLRQIPVNDPPARGIERFTGEYGRLRDVAETPDGAIWVLTNNTDGRGQPGADDDRVLQLVAQ